MARRRFGQRISSSGFAPAVGDERFIGQRVLYPGSSVPAPVVSSVNKSGLTRTQGGILVTITGTGFTGASSCTFGGTAGTSLTVVNDTTITVVTPAKAAGTHAVVVTTAGGSSNDTVSYKFVNPTSIFGANLKRWYDSTYAAGAWTDESGNFNTSQATAGMRPIASTFAGTTDRPATEFALSFDGTDDGLNMGDGADIVTTNYTMAWLASAAVAQNAEANVMSKNFTSEAFIMGIRSVAAGKMAGGSGGSTTTELAISNAAVNDDAVRRYIVTHNDASTGTSLSVNGTTQTDTGAGNYVTGTADFNAIGCAMQSEAVIDYMFTGKIAQCIIANVLANGTQLSELNAYLRDCAGQAS